MKAKKALTWLGVAFVVCFVVSSPDDSAGVVQSAFDGIETAMAQVARFLKGLA